MRRDFAERIFQNRVANTGKQPIRGDGGSRTSGGLRTQPAEAVLKIFAAWIVYAALSLLFFGLPIINHLSQTYIGGGTDPICHIWAIAWWPYAIAHRLNPLITHALWAPAGYNLVWGTDIPGPSLIIYPITRIFGPVVSYNLLCLLAPPAAAASTFVLCHYVCGRFWPALVGGYIFGFSPYILCHILAHLVLILVFLIPLAAYFTVLRIDGNIGRVGFGTGLIAILLLQFLSSTEIFATASLFGAMALVVDFILADKESRLGLISVAKEISTAYIVVIILLLPYLYYVFAPGLPNPPNPARSYSNDLLTFVLPPPVLLLGPHITTVRFGNFFATAPWWEQSAYLGPGLCILLALFAWSEWRTRIAKSLVVSFGVVAIMSLGPMLQVGGKPWVVMPWWLFNKLPLMNEALPGRFGLYLFLVSAVAASLYLARTSASFWSKGLLAGSSLLFIAPEFSIWRQIGQVPAFLGTPGNTAIHVPEFFRSGQYRRSLARGDNVLVLPLAVGGSNEGLLWQAESEFYFNTTDWFGAIAPADSDRWPIMHAFHSGTMIIDFPEQLEGFLGGHQVKAIIVDSTAPGRWPGMLSGIGLTGAAIGGVLFYKVPATVLVAFQGATAHELAEKYAAASFNALVSAASRYIEGGFPLAKFGLGEAQRLKLLNLPGSHFHGAGESRWQNLWLGSRGGRIGIGIAANFEDIQLLLDKYGPDAADIFFPFPKRLSKRRKQREGLLLMVFSAQGLQRAARKVNAQSGLLERTSPAWSASLMSRATQMKYAGGLPLSRTAAYRVANCH